MTRAPLRLFAAVAAASVALSSCGARTTTDGTGGAVPEAADAAAGHASEADMEAIIGPANGEVKDSTSVLTPARAARFATAPAAPVADVSGPGPQRTVIDQSWAPFAEVAGIVLTHPSRMVERIGFHQSNHEGAQQLTVLGTAAAPLELESRGRLTGSRTAADVVVDPSVEIRAPVTGTVKRAGTYTLYCDHTDDFAVIAPDARPAWEVKLLHIDGVTVRAGDRVEAGVTVLARGPTPLPFRSQVDDDTAEPSWPHVHIEVVDPSIPNQRSPGSGSEDC